MSEMPWDYSKPAEPGKGRPNLPTPEGQALGTELARLIAPRLAQVKELFPEVPPTCNECAFVAGTIPNGCAETLMDAVKCLAEREPFFCHKGVTDPNNPKRLCAGFVAAMSEIPKDQP